MKENLAEAKVLIERINRDLETLTKILQENCEELGWNFDIKIQYDHYNNYYRLNVGLDKIERIEW